MAQHEVVHNNGDLWEEPEAFLQRRGIVLVNGSLTERQLARELTRRGWRWQLEADTVRATKAYATTGTNLQSIVSHDPDKAAALASVLAGAIRFDEERGLTLTGPTQADIVVRAPDQRIVALVEVKGVRNFPDDLAANLRGNLVSYSRDYSLAPFFLLISQDMGYLWDQRAGVLPYSPTTQKFPMAPVVARYLPWVEPEEQLSASELRLAFAEWLRDLASPDPLHPAPAETVFAGSEFLDAIQGASVTTEARV